MTPNGAASHAIILKIKRVSRVMKPSHEISAAIMFSAVLLVSLVAVLAITHNAPDWLASPTGHAIAYGSAGFQGYANPWDETLGLTEPYLVAASSGGRVRVTVKNDGQEQFVYAKGYVSVPAERGVRWSEFSFTSDGPWIKGAVDQELELPSGLSGEQYIIVYVCRRYPGAIDFVCGPTGSSANPAYRRWTIQSFYIAAGRPVTGSTGNGSVPNTTSSLSRPKTAGCSGEELSRQGVQVMSTSCEGGPSLDVRLSESGTYWPDQRLQVTATVSEAVPEIEIMRESFTIKKCYNATTCAAQIEPRGATGTMIVTVRAQTAQRSALAQQALWLPYTKCAADEQCAFPLTCVSGACAKVSRPIQFAKPLATKVPEYNPSCPLWISPTGLTPQDGRFYLGSRQFSTSAGDSYDGLWYDKPTAEYDGSRVVAPRVTFFGSIGANPFEDYVVTSKFVNSGTPAGDLPAGTEYVLTTQRLSRAGHERVLDLLGVGTTAQPGEPADYAQIRLYSSDPGYFGNAVTLGYARYFLRCEDDFARFMFLNRHNEQVQRAYGYLYEPTRFNSPESFMESIRQTQGTGLWD
jgi:hypothetical protein